MMCYSSQGLQTVLVQEASSLLHSHTGYDADIVKRNGMSAYVQLNGAIDEAGNSQSGSLSSKASSNTDSEQLSTVGSTGVLEFSGSVVDAIQ